MKRVKIRPH